MCCCGSAPHLSTGGSPGLCNCTLTNVFHRVRGVCARPFFFYYPPTWAAAHSWEDLFVTISGRCVLLRRELIVAEDYPSLSMQHITF